MDKKKKRIIFWTCVLAFVVIVNLVSTRSALKGADTEKTYDVFLSELQDKNIDEVEVQSSVIYYTLKEDDAGETEKRGLQSMLQQLQGNSKRTYYTVRMDDDQLVERLYEAGATFAAVSESRSEILSTVISLLLYIGLPVLLYIWLMRSMSKKMGTGGGGGGFLGNMGKSNAKVYVKNEASIRFADVAGEDEAKEALQEIVTFLHNPQRYKKIGATMPKGALLVGPPGTGKTMLAKAVAGEARVPFISISGSEFVEMYVGMGAAKVRDLFKQAEEKAPCIVFIDEIDTVGKKRDTYGFAGNDEREQTLNQLLTEMDGFDASNGVVILGACNRPDVLDPALLRPGRFDRRIPVELPDYIGREAILRVHAKKVHMGSDVDLMKIAKAAAGASGADLANMINEGALKAVREGREFVTQEDLEESIETVLAGYKKKNNILSTKEKLVVSYHEIGHALVAAMQTNAAPVAKITIIPRTSGALGFTMQVDEEVHQLYTRQQLLDKIAVLTGGRAAEKLVFGEITTGAANDIEQATKLARAMVTRYGMTDEFGMVAMERVQNAYLGGDSSLQCSDAMAEQIDRKVIEIVQAQQAAAEQVLTAHMAQLHRLAEHLYNEETINGDEFMELLSRKEEAAI